MTLRPQFAPEPAVAARAAAASAAFSADFSAFRSDPGSGGPGFCTAALILKTGAAAPTRTVAGASASELAGGARATRIAAGRDSSSLSLRSAKYQTTPTYAPTSKSSAKRQGIGR